MRPTMRAAAAEGAGPEAATPPGGDAEGRGKAGFAHFERLHRTREDPWQVRTAWYERRKRNLVLAMLPRERYASAFEPGCSVGETTFALAPRCDRLVAADVSPSALATARRRLSPHAHVRLERWAVPMQWPAGALDLVVLGELGYYLPPADLDALWRRIAVSLAAGGHLLMCHARGCFGDAWRSGDDVHASAMQALSLAVVASYADERFRVDVLAAPRHEEPGS